jgi:5'-3' exonuclease
MNLVFIDTSYLIFYRYYAVLNWFKMSDRLKDIDPDKIVENKEFTDKFEKKCLDFFKVLEKNYKPDKIFICKDCPRKEIWRLELLPSYKGTRVNFVGKNIFNIFYENVLPKLLSNLKYSLKKCDKCEADDIVAIGVKTIREINPDSNITIFTSDHDYLQLLRFENLDIVDLKFKSLKAKSIGDNDLLYKILLGDKSDNISSVKKRLGKKTIDKLIKDNKLEELINSDSQIKLNYELNNNLINFNKIPDELKDNIKNIFEQI